MFTERELSDALEKMDHWYSEHFEELVMHYPGKAIAMVDNRVVAIADTEKQADEIARRQWPGSLPLVVTIPEPEELVCLI